MAKGLVREGKILDRNLKAAFCLFVLSDGERRVVHNLVTHFTALSFERHQPNSCSKRQVNKKLDNVF